MEDEPSAQPGVSSSAPALHVDAYNAVQSNLLMAQEYIAIALSSLRLTDITTYGESRCRIPTTIRDLNSYRAATNTEMKALHKKLGSLSTQLTKTLDKHTKVAQRGYIQRVGMPDMLARQRQQDQSISSGPTSTANVRRLVGSSSSSRNRKQTFDDVHVHRVVSFCANFYLPNNQLCK